MKEKSKLVARHFIYYKKIDMLLKSNSGRKSVDSDEYDFWSFINYALKQLDEDTYRIIYNEYILNKPPRWYTEYYSPSTYYRLKKAGLEKFLNCLH